MSTLEAAEAAVRHLQAARLAAQAGTGQAWQVQSDWKEAIRFLKLALDQARAGDQPRYAIERSEKGEPVRLWWVPPTREGSER